MMRIVITILLNLVILLLIVISVILGVRFYSAFQENRSLVATLFDNRALLAKMHIFSDDVWVSFEAPSFYFEHPPSWEPHQRELLGGETELVDLKIPIFFSISKLGADNVIGYSKDDAGKRRPIMDLLVEQDFIIANRKATKWIYKKNGYFHYEYIIAMQRYSLNGKNVSSFYLHAESTTRDENLEKKLDHIAGSVKFKADVL